MIASASPLVWWLTPLPGIVCCAGTFLTLWLVMRNRRWRDRSVLAKAVSMPPEHIAKEPKEIRDLRPGEAGWVARSSIVTGTKHNRVFVSWKATLQDEPRNANSESAPLRIVRLKRGFSLEMRPGREFQTSPLPWGYYAPVIEITRVVPEVARTDGEHTGP